MKTSNQEMNPLHDVSPEDAIGMLIADHKRVANLFADFKRITDEDGKPEEKAAVVSQICRELAVHTQLEEELFYPAVRAATHDDDQVDEAVVEHAGAKQLIAQLESALPEDDLYDAKVTVLGEQIDHHVEEEEGSMFPKARYSGLDTRELGAAMLARKSEILGGSPPLEIPHKSGPAEGKAALVKSKTAKPAKPAVKPATKTAPKAAAKPATGAAKKKRR